MGGDGGREGEG
uniref:Uncharacterized protein n=1 Tax=Arundo donax TaxID=35708 RepID=A0A0A9GIE3_ARUDO